jgi:hypothetical protein
MKKLRSISSLLFGLQFCVNPHMIGFRICIIIHMHQRLKTSLTIEERSSRIALYHLLHLGGPCN